MLLRFGVENMYSFREYQEISLVVPKVSDREAVRGLLQAPGIREPVVPVVGIYGANASGKSNLLACFHAFVGAIRRSHSQPGMPGRVRRPFLLDDASSKNPSRLECDVVVEGMRYQYGFRIDAQRILEEWLYAFPSGPRHRVLFHRHTEEQEAFYFGPSLKGNHRVVQAQTREDSLFLSAAGINNHKMLSILWNYFRNQVESAGNLDNRAEYSASNIRTLESSPSLRKDVIAFLREADTGISGIQLHETPTELKEKIVADIKRDFPTLVENIVNSTLFQKNISLEHRVGTTSYPLPYTMESRGTQTMLGLAIQVRLTLDKGGLLVVDEIESGLHPFTAMRLVEVFQNEETNPHGAQILFATHNTHLLADALAPAQVWLCEKNPQGATEIYPLTSTQPRKGENLERGYLKGRYGGVPYLGPIEELWRRPPSVPSGA